jgi:IS5 family transposase
MDLFQNQGAKLSNPGILGARSFPHNPYDGHTLNEQLEQAQILSNITIRNVYVDLGYRGVDADNPTVSIKHRGKSKRFTEQERRLLKRRQAIEPIIGHLKADHRMNRCHLKWQARDAIHAVLCAAGHYIRWLLRMIRKKGISLFLSLLKALRLATCLQVMLSSVTVKPLSGLRTRAERAFARSKRIFVGRLVTALQPHCCVTPSPHLCMNGAILLMEGVYCGS